MASGRVADQFRAVSGDSRLYRLQFVAADLRAARRAVSRKSATRLTERSGYRARSLASL